MDWSWGIVKKGERSTVTVRMSRDEGEGAEWCVRVEQGVLQEVGTSETVWADAYSEKEAANAAGRAGHRLGRATARTAIKDSLSEEHRAWFSAPVAPLTMKNRLNRAIADAEKAGYLTRAKNGFDPGPVVPPPAESATLDALLGTGIRIPGELVAQ